MFTDFCVGTLVRTRRVADPETNINTHRKQSEYTENGGSIINGLGD